jgi:microcystin-dependent protein
LDDNSVTTGKIVANAVTIAKIDFQNALVPVGGIIMWSGTTVPTGWSLCNGSNGTPNLRNRFIVAADSLTKTGTTSQSGTSPYDPGDVGGSADSIVVSHSHTVTSSSAAAGGGFKAFFIAINRILRFPPNDAMDSMLSGPSDGDFTDPVGGIPTSSIGRGNIDSAGSSATNANLPPYYALAFIMRTS